MDKVYVLIVENSGYTNDISNVYAFTNKAKAIDKMQHIFSDELEYWKKVFSNLEIDDYYLGFDYAYINIPDTTIDFNIEEVEVE